MVGAGVEGVMTAINLINVVFGPKPLKPPPQESELVKCLTVVTKRLETAVANEFNTKFKGSMTEFCKVTREHVQPELANLLRNLKQYKDAPDDPKCYLNNSNKLNLYQQYVNDFTSQNNDLNQLNVMLGWYEKRPLADQVAGIVLYFMVMEALIRHINYLANMQLVLNLHSDPPVEQERPIFDWKCLEHDIVDVHLVAFLDQAIEFGSVLLKKLQDGFDFIDNINEEVKKKFAVIQQSGKWGISINGATPKHWFSTQAEADQAAIVPRGQAMPAMIRGKTDALHLDKITREELKHCFEILGHLENIRTRTLDSASTSVQMTQVTHDKLTKDNPPKPRARKASEVTKIHLAYTPGQGLLRVRFESSAKKGWVGVVGRSIVGAGNIVTQNAGSNDVGIYYQVDGGGLNGTFKAELDADPSQLDDVNGALIDAYDDLYGDDSYTMDSVTTPQDKTKPAVVPLKSGQGRVAENVVAMLYSIGPKLPSDGLKQQSVRSTYKDAYVQGFIAVLDWNAKQQSDKRADFIRLTFLSCGIYASKLEDAAKKSGDDAAALDTKKVDLFTVAAECILEAALDVMANRPEMKDLGLIVNVNDNTSHERVAMTNAANKYVPNPVSKAKVTTIYPMGFDLWAPHSGPAWPPVDNS